MIKNGHHTCGGKNICGKDIDDFSVRTKNSSKSSNIIMQNTSKYKGTFSRLCRKRRIHVSTMRIVNLLVIEVDSSTSNQGEAHPKLFDAMIMVMVMTDTI